MIIREYKDTDKPSVIDFLERQLDELNSFDPFDRKRKEGYGEYSINNLLEQNKDKGKIYIAEFEGVPVGYISGWIKLIEEFEYQTGGPVLNGMLDNIYVLPDYRKKGIGSQLIKELENYFIGKKCKFIWLNVFSENQQAMKLYNRLGYFPNATTAIKKLEY